MASKGHPSLVGQSSRSLSTGVTRNQQNLRYISSPPRTICSYYRSTDVLIQL